MKTPSENLKQRLITDVIHREGDYVNHPSDRGGPTRWGITEKVARVDGYKGSMKEFPVERAFAIYDRKYYTGPGFDKVALLSLKSAEELFDTGVNAGPKRAVTFLQRALNVLNARQRGYKDVEVDGDLGPATLEALTKLFSWRQKTEAELVLLRALESLQGAHYIALAEANESQEDFVYGWLRTRLSLK